ncbi:MAG: hypothetical protein ISN26_07935 [Betaproteobacteria bacterium AqS2]|uniref:Uncharacterized protein n=1 Tax=Candidatus Amphirhobacter heronislandensis TaxID=1732024 RepID=A0A930UEB5_9GAMM|nr:hypothetical protein [Betaproteobacteria bacterium AqS2]
MAAQEQGPAPELEGPRRGMALALAGLHAHFAAKLFSSQIQETVTPMTLACINGMMRKRGVIPAKEIERFWKAKGGKKVLYAQERIKIVEDGAAQVGEAMGRLVLEILAAGGGVALSGRGADRARTLVQRLAKGGPVFLKDEYSKMSEGCDPEAFSTTEDIKRALRRAREGKVPLGPADIDDPKRAAVLTAGFFFACFAKSWTYIIGSEISTPLLGQYQKVLCAEGLTTPERLIKLWTEEEDVQETMEGLTRECLGDAGETIGDCIVRLCIDVIDDGGADGAPLTPAAAARAEEFLARMGAENKAFSDEEAERMDGGWHQEIPRDGKEVQAAMAKIVRAQAH